MDCHILAEVDSDQLEQMRTDFRKLTTDNEKYRYAYNLPEAMKQSTFQQENLKDKIKSNKFKELGNGAYKQHQVTEAIR